MVRKFWTEPGRGIMKQKKCRKCGKENPPFFTHCVDCGSRLVEEPGKSLKIPAYMKTGLIVGVFLVLAYLIIPPVVQYSLAFGKNFSGTSSVTPDTGYPINKTVENNGLQITVISARDGQTFQNSYRFFIVTVFLKNVRTSGNVQISNNDFEVIDLEGRRYIPYGIGSQVTYEIRPGQDTTAELNFIIPKSVVAKKIRFTLPVTATFANVPSTVEFVV
jgi:hypothetical protein